MSGRVAHQPAWVTLGVPLPAGVGVLIAIQVVVVMMRSVIFLSGRVGVGAAPTPRRPA